MAVVSDVLCGPSSHLLTAVEYLLMHSNLGSLGKQVLVANGRVWVISQGRSLLGKLFDEFGVVLEESLRRCALESFLYIRDEFGFGLGLAIRVDLL
jgi:hypothetical protein